MKDQAVGNSRVEKGIFRSSQSEPSCFHRCKSAICNARSSAGKTCGNEQSFPAPPVCKLPPSRPRLSAGVLLSASVQRRSQTAGVMETKHDQGTKDRHPRQLGPRRTPTTGEYSPGMNRQLVHRKHRRHKTTDAIPGDSNVISIRSPPSLSQFRGQC